MIIRAISLIGINAGLVYIGYEFRFFSILAISCFITSLIVLMIIRIITSINEIKRIYT